MAKYYVNNKAQANGEHEVHVSTCLFMPMSAKYLGDFTHCADAVRAAKAVYPQTNGCYLCSKECHTG